MNRTDIHRPSAIVPADYEFVACQFVKVNTIGDCQVIKAERERLAAHMAQTGGTRSTHEHGGNCAVCGSVNAIYNSIFYHAKSNTYISVGSDCTNKLDSGAEFAINRFRKQVEDVREYQAGRQKAAAILGDRGWSKAWEIFTADRTSLMVNGRMPYEENIILDMVSKLVKYGTFASEKQASFLGSLVAKVNARTITPQAANEAKLAQWAAEKAAAAPCPTGRVQIEGQIISTKIVESNYGSTLKILVKTAAGFKVWGTAASSLCGNKGDIVRFSAEVTPSKDDRSFGFFSRPTKATTLQVAD